MPKHLLPGGASKTVVAAMGTQIKPTEQAEG